MSGKRMAFSRPLLQEVWLGIRTFLKNRRQGLEFLLNLIFSPEIIRRIRYHRIVKKEGSLQKYWIGGDPVHEASPTERAYFEAKGMTSRIVCCGDEYRSAGRLEAGASFRADFSPAVAPGESVQFAFSSDVLTEKTHSVAIFVNQEKEPTMRLFDLGRDCWRDLRIPANLKAIESLRIETNFPVFLTMPRIVRKTTATKTPKHVIVLIVDSLSPLFMHRPHPLHTAPNSLPNTERFFASGFKSLNGFSSAEWTLPAVSSIYSGQYPGRHRIYHPKLWVEYPKNRPTLSERLQKAGFHNFFAAAVGRMNPSFGLLRGFDRFFYHFHKYSAKAHHSLEWIDETIAHLELHRQDRSFTYLHFPDVHPIWESPVDNRYVQLGRKGTFSYDLERNYRSKEFFPQRASQNENHYLLKLADLDRMLAHLYRYIDENLRDETLVLLTADHGAFLPEVNDPPRKEITFLSKIRTNIPFYVRGPGIRAETYDGFTQPNIDLAKVILESVGLSDQTSDMDGLNVTGGHAKRDFAISESTYKGVYELVLRDQRFLYLRKYATDKNVLYRFKETTPVFEGLFLDADLGPDSSREIGAENPDRLKAFRARADAHLRNVGLIPHDPHAPGAAKPEVDAASSFA